MKATVPRGYEGCIGMMLPARDHPDRSRRWCARKTALGRDVVGVIGEQRRYERVGSLAGTRIPACWHAGDQHRPRSWAHDRDHRVGSPLDGFSATTKAIVVCTVLFWVVNLVVNFVTVRILIRQPSVGTAGLLALASTIVSHSSSTSSFPA